MHVEPPPTPIPPQNRPPLPWSPSARPPPPARIPTPHHSLPSRLPFPQPNALLTPHTCSPIHAAHKSPLHEFIGSFRRELAFRCYLEVLGGGLEDFVSRRIMFSTGGVAVFLISDLDKVGGL
ncbi:hypothetical protein M758_3G049800 [Ceratodon purpureus]|nr:hypothetical protein M758_3G049800 [Ceratodon purpureus]